MNTDPWNTPLLDALNRKAQAGRSGLHMPGHDAGRLFSSDPLAAIGALDTTELPDTDDINDPTGPAAQAMELAARAFGAGRTWFLTGGSTSGVLSMIALARMQGRTLLLPHAVHRSVLHAVILTRIPYRFIRQCPEPDADASFPVSAFQPPTPDEVRDALNEAEGPCAVFVTSPDYYGLCADLPALAELAQEKGALLLVDEAQGAHFRFGGSHMPIGAMEAGADLCVHSAHKTLPALTQAALLHASASSLDSGRVNAATVREAIRLFHTTSPSFPVAASIDYARAFMEQYGAQRIETLIQNVRAFSRMLPDGMHVAYPPVLREVRPIRDPTRLVIDTAGSGYAAHAVYRMLTEAGIDMELADPRRLVGILPLVDSRTRLDRLARTLATIAHRKVVNKAAIQLDRDLRSVLLRVPERVRHPADVLFPDTGTEWVPVREAEDRVAAAPIVPYPPGVPLVWPGERLDRDVLAAVSARSDAGLETGGVRNKGSAGQTVSVFCVRNHTGSGVDHV